MFGLWPTLCFSSRRWDPLIWCQIDYRCSVVKALLCSFFPPALSLLNVILLSLKLDVFTNWITNDNLILKQHCVFCFLFMSCQFWQFIDLLLGERDLWYWHRTLIKDNITDHLPRSRALFSLMTSSCFCWVCFVYFGHCENTETSRQANSMKPDEWCHCCQIVFLAKIYPCACLLSLYCRTQPFCRQL